MFERITTEKARAFGAAFYDTVIQNLNKMTPDGSHRS
jgi:hypothetical protein